MGNVKRHLFDTLVEEFNTKPSFLLAKTLFLFCNYNSAFELPREVNKAFVNGLLEDEIRAFSLRYQKKDYETDSGSIDAMQKEMYDAIAAENLSRGTGKTYSPGMVDTVTTKFKKILSYNEILETFIMAGR
jgi:hypothetical protein